MQSISHIVDYLRRGERLTTADAVILWREAPLWLLSELAVSRKRASSGELVYYNRNIHLEPSNICIFNCEFCSFRRRQGDADAWNLTLDQIEERAGEMVGKGITEVHIVGGVHPDHTLDTYCEMIRRVKRALPDVAIKAYTAVEISYMIRRAELTLEQGLRRLMEAGMESIPGGGAELFDEELRAKLCPDKCSSEEWLAVHRTAHNLGLDTNCTMLYGHVETIEQRVDHLNRLRELQDEAPGFNAFIPLKYRSRNNRMSECGECSVEEDMRMIAMSRIFLDNIPHIKAYWVAYGKSVTEMALAFGADDIDGTIDDSTKIYSMAGADARPTMSVEELEAMVHDAGFVAVERDTHYNELKRSEPTIAVVKEYAEDASVERLLQQEAEAEPKEPTAEQHAVVSEQIKEETKNIDMEMNKKSGNAGTSTHKSAGKVLKGGGLKAMLTRSSLLLNAVLVGVCGILLLFCVYFGLMLGTRHGKQIVVPNFIEMSVEEAKALARDLDLQIIVSDSVHEADIAGGMVIDQRPAPSIVREVTVKPDRKIYLTVNAYTRRMVRVPYVANQSLRQAINQLERDGFNIERLIYVPHSYDGQILDQKVAGRTITRTTNLKLPEGSDVTLYVGYRAGKQYTSVPQLMGMRLSQAKNALWTSGLNVNKVVYDESITDLKSRRLARVYMQTQPSKKGVTRGTKVSIYLTCDDKLIDSLSKISDRNSKYYEEQRRLMEQEAEQEAARQEAEEAERQAAEAEAGDVATGVDGDVMINGEEPKQEAPSLIAPPPATDAEVDDSVVE
ncbi:MAG: aminofutalosine synthase MqnE [Alistipes sp.]|nr:aminofutalosine synthase MqnE [Alistipes sp.]